MPEIRSGSAKMPLSLAETPDQGRHFLTYR